MDGGQQSVLCLDQESKAKQITGCQSRATGQGGTTGACEEEKLHIIKQLIYTA